MIVYLFVGLFVLLLLWLVPDKNKGLRLAFIVITIFLSIRYMWGRDYPAYLEMFVEINGSSGSLSGSYDNVVEAHNEFGWIFLNRLCGLTGIGFFGLVIVLTVFECWVIHRMIKKFVPSKYYWVAILMWYFSADSFCVNASMMRQYLCICIYLLVVELMVDKRVKLYWLWAIGIILLEATIHRSSIIQIVSLPLFYINVRKTQFSSALVAIIGVVFVFWSMKGPQWIEPYLRQFLTESDDYSQYMIYLGEVQTGTLSSGLGVLFRYVMFAAWLFILPKIDKQHQPVLILMIFSYFFEVVASVAPLAGRLGLYFSMLSMVCWVSLFELAKRENYLFLLFVGQLAIMARSSYRFFFSPLWSSSYFDFHTILSAPGWM